MFLGGLPWLFLLLIILALSLLCCANNCWRSPFNLPATRLCKRPRSSMEGLPPGLERALHSPRSIPRPSSPLPFYHPQWAFQALLKPDCSDLGMPGTVPGETTCRSVPSVFRCAKMQVFDLKEVQFPPRVGDFPLLTTQRRLNMEF